MTDSPVSDPLGGLVRIGIQALREGDRAGARSLFRALARRHPDDLRIWIWLAAAAETKAERRGALERVLELDPTNSVALKGLAALDAPMPSQADTLAGEVPPSPELLSRGRRRLQMLWVVLLILILVMAALLVSNPRAWSWVRSAAAPPTPLLSSLAPTGGIIATPSQAALSASAAPLLAATPGLPTLPPATVPLPASRRAPSPPGMLFERDGWRLGLLAGPQSVALDAIGPLAPTRGRFVVVLLTVANTGAAPRLLDPAQVVLVDGQGRSYAPQPEASALYLDSAGGRGVAGDLAFGEPLPNSGGNLSIPLAFDVPVDAAELMLVVRSGGEQMGWIVQI